MRRRALAVDDERIAAAILASNLRRWDIDVTVATSGAEAWDILSRGDAPSLALIDWMMPGLSGPELCTRIRSTPALSHMYVILLTGRDGRADMVAGLDAGADDYVVKPFEAEELRARVQVGLRVAALQERLAAQVIQLRQAHDDLAHLVGTDVLTGARSRRAWFDLADLELQRSRRYGHPLSVLMVDIDHFKAVNDQHGHAGGDTALRAVADHLLEAIRKSDVFGRLGGEEFAVLLPGTELGPALETAHRLVESCRKLEVPGPGGPIHLTCSIGAAQATSADPHIDDVLRRADAALYSAKHSGRNRAEGADAPLVAPDMPAAG